MIPEFVESGLLPAGIYQATVAEFEERFAYFDRSDRRIQIYGDLKRLFDELRRVKFVKRVLIAGSFVTSKPEPNDFDCIVVIDANSFPTEIRPFEYQVVSRRMARKTFRGDVVAVVEGTQLHERYMKFFQTSRDGSEAGMVEVLL